MELRHGRLQFAACNGQNCSNQPTEYFKRSRLIWIFALFGFLSQCIGNATPNHPIRIVHPLNGSWIVTTPRPITVAFFIDDSYRHTNATVDVSLDSRLIAEVRKESFVELPSFANSGWHHVAVTLRHHGIALAAHTTIFFVQQPHIRILYPTNTTFLHKSGGESVLFVLKLTIVVDSAASLFVEVGPRILWREIDRSDHQLVKLEVQHGDLQGGMSDSDFPRVRVGVRVHDASMDSDPTCASDESCRAAPQSGRLLCADEVVFQVNVTDQQPEVRRPRQCKHAFLDLGSRDGGGLLRLTDPLRFWASSPPFNWFKNLSMLLVPDLFPGNLCLVGIEGNPNLGPKLKLVEDSLVAAGWEVEMLSGTVAWHEDGEMAMRLDYRNPQSGWASSILPRYDAEDDGEVVRVRSVDLGAILRRTRARLPEEGQLVLKMDIEGSEYEVLRRLVGDGTVCATVDLLLMEWHPGVAEGVPAHAAESLQWLLEAPSCRTTVWPHCGEE